jgi:large subunit ribosomal protein L46
MNTWIVGNHPIGHHQYDYHDPILSKIAPNRLVSTSRKDLEQEEYGEKVFFMKGRIMAGQADLTKNEYEDTEYAWLSKEEVAQKVGLKYWSSVKNMLAER